MNRRDFLATGAGSLAGLGLTNMLQAAPGPAPVDVGEVSEGKVLFSSDSRPEGTPGPISMPMPADDRIGFAVVGLGRLSLEQILPAFCEAKKARLAGLISGTPDKADVVARQYGVKPASVYSYDHFDQIRDNPEIQAVYIVLPNALHAEYTVRAAQAGKHVLCEKPMATQAKDAQEMVDACARAGRKLMIAYRCQYEVKNRAVIESVRAKKLGTIGMIEANNYQNQGDPGQWRLKKALSGGGSLPDIGLYCLNSSRAVLNEEPSEVLATISTPAHDPRFVEVEDSISFILKFPSGALAVCSSSYSQHDNKRLTVFGSEGIASIENAFAYHGQELKITLPEPEGDSVSQKILPDKNQFALELDHMASCIQNDVTPHTPGEEGLQDQRIMEAIYRSAQSGRPVALVSPPAPTRGPDPVLA